MAKVYIVSFRTHDDRRPSKFIVLADNMRCAITMVWEDGGSDFQSRFDKSTAMRFLFSGRHMRINNIGGYTPVPLKFKLAVFFSALTHRIAIKVSHSAALSNDNDCSHSVIGSLKFSVGLCIRSHPHAAREGIPSIKPPIVGEFNN